MNYLHSQMCYGFLLAKDTVQYRRNFIFWHMHLEATRLYREMWGG